MHAMRKPRVVKVEAEYRLPRSTFAALSTECLTVMRSYDCGGSVSAVMLGSVEESPGGELPGWDVACRVWAADLVQGLARDLPTVVTRADIAERLTEVGSDRDADSTINELRRLGWLVGLPVHGVWAFLAPGHDDVSDQYLVLRAWVARDRPGFLLAGRERGVASWLPRPSTR